MNKTREALARQLADSFTTATRDNGETFTKCKGGTPQWIKDAIQAAHNDVLPNDWIYATCSAVADDLADRDPDEWEDFTFEIADSLVDVYTTHLTRWLHEFPWAHSVCDEACEELGMENPDTLKRISLGQFYTIRAIAEELIRAIEEEAEA